MKVCTKCNLEYDDDCMFCKKCGGNLASNKEKVYCQYCGKLIEEDSDFCPFCGKAFVDEAISIIEETAVTKKHIEMQQHVCKHKKDFFTYNTFFSNKGRMGRLDYFKVSVVWIVVAVIIQLLVFFIKLLINIDFSLFISIVTYPFSLYSSYCVFVKRFHDLNEPPVRP